MPTTLEQLKLAVAGFMQRDIANFLRNDVGREIDLLHQACNNARLYAERMIDFELSWAHGYVVVQDLTAGVDLSTCVTYETRNEGEPTLLAVKKVMCPFILNVDQTIAAPVPLYSKRKWNNWLKRKLENFNPTQQNQTVDIGSLGVCVIQEGSKLFVNPASLSIFPTTILGNVFIQLDCIKWLTPYVDDDDTDFLLDYAFDWMMYRSIYELNFFLKEDERVAISTDLMTDAFNAIVKWNNELINSTTDDNNLD